jgi:hypothetical protein
MSSVEISFEQQAGRHEQYAPDAFTSQVGQRVRLSVQGEPRGTCMLVAAEVSPDGRSVTLTYDVPDDIAHFASRLTHVREVSPFSLGLTFPPAEPAPGG